MPQDGRVGNFKGETLSFGFNEYNAAENGTNTNRKTTNSNKSVVYLQSSQVPED